MPIVTCDADTMAINEYSFHVVYSPCGTVASLFNKPGCRHPTLHAGKSCVVYDLRPQFDAVFGILNAEFLAFQSVYKQLAMIIPVHTPRLYVDYFIPEFPELASLLPPRALVELPIHRAYTSWWGRIGPEKVDDILGKERLRRELMEGESRG